MDVSYAVVAEFDGDDVPPDQQMTVNRLLSRDDVVQVSWTKRATPRPRPAGPRPVVVAMVLLNHAATEDVAVELSEVVAALSLVTEVRVERPGSPQRPISGVAVPPPNASWRSGPAADAVTDPVDS